MRSSVESARPRPARGVAPPGGDAWRHVLPLFSSVAGGDRPDRVCAMPCLVDPGDFWDADSRRLSQRSADGDAPADAARLPGSAAPVASLMPDGRGRAIEKSVALRRFMAAALLVNASAAPPASVQPRRAVNRVPSGTDVVLHAIRRLWDVRASRRGGTSCVSTHVGARRGLNGTSRARVLAVVTRRAPLCGPIWGAAPHPVRGPPAPPLYPRHSKRARWACCHSLCCLAAAAGCARGVRPGPACRACGWCCCRAPCL